MFNLIPKFDSRNSFYGKAIVVREGSALVLYSYHTKVATIQPNGDHNAVTLYPAWDYSATTLRHVKEFIRQFSGNDQRLTKRDLAKIAK